MTMKRLSFFIMMAVLALATSCNSDDDGIICIEPGPMFQFEEGGTPYRTNMPTIPADLQATMKKELIGYGWKWMQTNEIYDNGYVEPTDYYQDMYGQSPVSYYFESDSQITCFFHDDAINKDVHCTGPYIFDFATGKVIYGTTDPEYSWQFPMWMRVWTVYEVSGKWYMSCVSEVARRHIEGDKFKAVWAVSHYQRMTDSELKKMQKKHDSRNYALY